MGDAAYTRADYDRDVRALQGLDTREGGAALAAGAISEEALMDGYAEIGRLLYRVRAFERVEHLPATAWYYDGTKLYKGAERILAPGETVARYVVGFLFAREWVLLLRKNRPAWQAGRLNGPGGKVEPGETFLQAMIREFREEVQSPESLDLTWEHFATLKGVERSGQPYEIAYFRAGIEMRYVSGVTHPYLEYDEPPAWYPVDPLPDAVLPNVRWLIPMAVHRPLSHGWPYTVVEGAPNPQDCA